MPIHLLNVKPLYFEDIRLGSKTVEGRIADEKYRSVMIGDTLVFLTFGESLSMCVEEVRLFCSFESMLRYFGVSSCLPRASGLIEGINLYHAFGNYKDRALECGVIGIRFSSLFA